MIKYFFANKIRKNVFNKGEFMKLREKLKEKDKQEIKNVTLRLPNNLYEELQTIKDTTGINIVSLITIALWKFALKNLSR